MNHESEYLIPSEIELTDSEKAMLEKHGIHVFDLEKMSKQELEDAYKYFIEMGM